MKRQWSSFTILLAAMVTFSFIATPAHALPSGKKSPEEKAGQMAKDAIAAYNLGVEHQQRADTLLAHSDSAKASKEFKVALKEFEKSVKLNPNSPEALNNLGYCRRNLGDYAKALEAYDQALKLKPDFPEAMEYRGVALVKMGRIDDAMAQYSKLKAIDSTEATELLEAIRKATGGKSLQSANPPQR